MNRLDVIAARMKQRLLPLLEPLADPLDGHAILVEVLGAGLVARPMGRNDLRAYLSEIQAARAEGAQGDVDDWGSVLKTIDEKTGVIVLALLDDATLITSWSRSEPRPPAAPLH
jgi:hypothetical protein